MLPVEPIYHNRLPHLTPLGGTFFITFRLDDALPISVNRQLYHELEQALHSLRKTKPADLKEKLVAARKRSFAKFDQELDHKPFGECWLEKRKSPIL